MSLFSLPPEALESIALRLDLQSLRNLACTCRGGARVARSPRQFQSRLLSHFGLGLKVCAPGARSTRWPARAFVRQGRAREAPRRLAALL